MSNIKDRDRLLTPQDLEDHSDIRDMLLVIHKKVLASSALNGGFDTLIHKMDNFEKRQDKIIESVDEIHDAVYNPDKGLFARIKDSELTQIDEIHALNAEIITLKLRQEVDGREHVKDVESDKELKKIIEALKIEVTDLKNGYSIFKWLGITFGGGFILATIKAFYDYITQHIKFF